MRSAQQAQVEEFLRREYGVRDFRTENGKRHLKLIWQYQGQEFTRWLSYGSHVGHPGDLQLRKAEIRRMMGGRPKKEGKTMEEQMAAVRERAIEDIATIPDEADSSRMPEPDNYPEPEPDKPEPVEAPPACTWAVKAAAYNLPEGRPAVHFEFPAVIRQTIPSFRLEQIDAEHWRIRRHGPRRWSTSRSGSGACTTMSSDCEPFRSVTVEAVEVDGEVLVFVPMSARQPLRPPHRTMRAVQTPRPEPQPSEPQPAPLLQPERTLEDGMRAVLRYAREIEALSPYRLIRVNDGLSWRAPTIE
jgi:hypothetical protein